ncbi:MAG: D-2-hydroxyacid dehydrogenase [Chloroflexota bacterium]|nr:D-2-hydroxyacid dehydrogenase [Chloroflexota bacterium]
MAAMAERVKILSPLQLEEKHWERVRQLSPRISLSLVEGEAQFLESLPDAEVVVIWPRPFDLSLAPRLKWIQLISAGLDRFVGHPIMESDIIITTASGIHATPIAEYVLASILAFSRRFRDIWQLQVRREWPEDRWQSLRGEELRGKTVGILGYGSIGREVGRLCKAFGMRVLATDSAQEREDRGYRPPGTGDPKGMLLDSLFPPSQLREMLKGCDFFVVAVPLTLETEGMVGREELKAMKRNAYLVNISRGQVVDEEALIEALKEGWIGGAGLDVFAQEPLPPESELWGLDNVILSPHISANTPHYQERFTALFCENLRRYLAGEELLNMVDKKRGY